MLTDDDGSIDADNFPVGECLANHSHRLGVAVGLIVSRHYHCSVQQEGSRKRRRAEGRRAHYHTC